MTSVIGCFSVVNGLNNWCLMSLFTVHDLQSFGLDNVSDKPSLSPSPSLPHTHNNMCCDGKTTVFKGLWCKYFQSLLSILANANASCMEISFVLSCRYSCRCLCTYLALAFHWTKILNMCHNLTGGLCLDRRGLVLVVLIICNVFFFRTYNQCILTSTLCWLLCVCVCVYGPSDKHDPPDKTPVLW